MKDFELEERLAGLRKKYQEAKDWSSRSVIEREIRALERAKEIIKEKAEDIIDVAERIMK